ncbi:family 78 glycoside hydrolase catalytic domain [Paenibacillus allorhizosphaerae]|uniref:Alpha-L-rhamnosidase n=1 Tax=Paenibacillus allorhizosphaerae TaxID=2849866 RepID=A0ABM8VHZ2_9BACL|nr:alpha-L-rhamnosidase [Paenibacillus allorhizosphaerae]CAG7643051.1 Alpha-L-rhamnosidase [Paenibacillus allorhizosphaerae]
MGLQVVRLKCEYKNNPLGLDVRKPRLGWNIEASRRNTNQSAYRIHVSKEDPDFNTLVWDTGTIDSDQSVHIVYEGTQLEPRTRYYYRVRVWDDQGTGSEWSSSAYWETGLMETSAWKAEWISPSRKPSDGTGDKPAEEPADYVRKPFTSPGKVRSARIYATALGLYTLYLNGRRVSDDLFTPGWTSYNKRLQYQTYDVTGLIGQGENVVGAVLADGWYKGNLAWKGVRNLYGDRRAFLMQLHVKFEDGSEQVWSTDRSWHVSSSGPIRMAELYHGEQYDATLELTGWSSPDYNASSWTLAEVLDHPKGHLVAQENDPTRVVEDIQPIAVIHTPKGETVIDMGQNMVGWVRFTVNASAGHRIVLEHAEVLDKEGNFYTANLRSAKQRIEYICKGGDAETYEPHFTFQGFRYVKVEGWDGEPDLSSFTGRVIHTDMDHTGFFECSDPLINQLQHNILWGQKGNFLDIPTDCPQRDERLGWTGDAQVFIRTAAFNMNVAPFFTKWLRDLKADQFEDGAVPHVIPDALPADHTHSSAAWGDAAVICPWTVYLCYGDTRILEEQYDSMKAWVEYMRRQGDNEFLRNTGFHYGDWLGLDAKEGSYRGATPNDYIATAFYAYSTSLLAKTAEILGNAQDAEQYRLLHRRIVEAFNKEFVTPAGRLAAPTQTAHVLALMFDLVDGAVRRRVAGTLAKMVEQNKDRLTTGFVGTPYLCHVLSQNGYHETAVKLVLQKEYPSWLYSVLKGATTMWEHWDGIKPDGSFWSTAMNSYNHYAYGSIGDWMYQVLAGLDTDRETVGYKHLQIRPQPSDGFEWVRAKLVTMYGTVESGWRKQPDGRLTVEITLPPNTTASVELPKALLAEVQENGRRAETAEGIISCRQAEGNVRLRLGSGTYTFSYPFVV